MLELRELTKTFDQVTVLRDFHLNVAVGEVIALLGTSGCGKSTLLRIVTGLIAADRGSVWWQGTAIEPRELRWRQRIGYVIQEGGLFPHLTLRQNVLLLPRELGWTPSQCRQRLEELTSLTHLLPELLDRYPRQVSGGQRQRVALMRALFLDPEILLLDEPLGALDPLIRAELQQELGSIIRSMQKTVLLVTHDVREAALLANRIVLMRAGRIVQIGLIEELLNNPAEPFVTQFLQAQWPAALRGMGNHAGPGNHESISHYEDCGPLSTQKVTK